MNEWLNAVPAISSAVAAALAVVATWRSPIVAARLSEKLRRDAEREHQTMQRKLDVLASLMQERADLYSASGARMLNQIDIVFSKAPKVRDAWARLLEASQNRSVFPPLVPDEQLTHLLSVMAQDVGLSGRLSANDMARVYFPDAMREARLRDDLERQQALEQLLNATRGAQQASSDPPPTWPSPPRDD